MAHGKLLRQLIKTGAEGDADAFRRVSQQVIAEERAKNHHLLANDLERILNGRPRQAPAAEALFRHEIPRDKEQGLPLLRVQEPVRRLEEMVLEDTARESLEGILAEHRRQDILRSHGLLPADRILFFGPPGCGKSLAAEVMARELDLPIVLVRLDSVVSSFLGATAANLEAIFGFISTHPSIAFFDEFDALAKERSYGNDHGELMRVVNALLQMMDGYQGRSVLVAATNHEHILDSAVFRRFEESIHFCKPTPRNAEAFLRLKLRGVRRDFSISESGIFTMFENMAYSEIERALRRAIKLMLLEGEKFLRLRHIEKGLVRERMKEGQSG